MEPTQRQQQQQSGGEHRAKAFQFMLARGCVKACEFEEFLNSLRGNNASQLSEERIGEAVGNLNNTLTRFNMRIRATTDDKTHDRYYSLISTVDNDITHQASHHTPKEFEYFKLIWQKLQDGESTMDEMKTVASRNKILNYEELLKEWHEKHWLVIEDDTVRLGVRSKAELDVLTIEPNQSMQSMDDSR